MSGIPPTRYAPTVPVIKRVRTKQPQTPVGIDWGNPLASSLNLAFNPAIEQGISRVIRPGGVLGSYSAAAKSIDTSIAARLTQDRTLFALIIAGGSYSAFPHAVEIGASSSDAGSVLGIGASNTGVVRFYGSTGISSHILSGTIYQSGQHAYATRKTSAGVLTGFVDGLVAGTSSGATGLTPPTGFYIGGNAVGTARWPNQVGLVLQWNRALSDAEIKSLSDNPWQIFQPDEPELIVPTTSDAVPSIATRQPITPRQSQMLGTAGVGIATVAPSFVRGVRTSQPQTPVGIDWGNPLNYKLSGAVLPHIRHTASGRLTLNNVTKMRMFAGKAGALYSPYIFDNGGLTDIVNTGNWAPNAPFTISSYFQINSVGNTTARIVCGHCWGSNNFGWLVGHINSVPFGSVVWGGGGTFGTTVSGLSSVTWNTPHMITLVVYPTTVDLYIDGIFQSSASHSYAGSIGQPLRLYQYGTIYGDPTGAYQVAQWNRCLSKLEVEDLWNNPYQIWLTTENNKVWVPT